MNIKTYITSGKINNAYYPQKNQGMLLRSYCHSLGLGSVLHTTLQLSGNQGVFSDIDEKDVLIFVSAFLIEDVTLNDFNELLEFVGRKKEIHFVLESRVITTKEQLIELKDEISFEAANKSSRDVGASPFKNQEFSLVTPNHLGTIRDYQARATNQKPVFAKMAKEFDYAYWDGERDTGYGGYKDDGRWQPIAQKLIKQYNLSNSSSVLDIGCGKGYLLAELKKLCPGMSVRGLDISQYAISRAHESIREFITQGSAVELPYSDNSFNFVFSNMTLHNLELPQLHEALREIERVGQGQAWIGVESYRSEEEKWNLMRWQLTCECFFTPSEWQFVFNQAAL